MNKSIVIKRLLSILVTMTMMTTIFTGMIFAEDAISPTAPVLAFAAVNTDGNSIRMNFDHFMADSGDTEANFTVNTPEGKVNVTNVLYYPNVTTNDVLLLLERPIYAGEPVTVDYTGGTTAIRTMEGVELANFTGYSVTNNSTVTGGGGGIEMPSAPVLAFAAVNADGNSIRMNFDHFMADSGDTEANFRVNTPEGKVNVINVLYYPNVTTNDVLLILEHPIYTGEPVTVDYTGGTTAIRTMEGVELANFTGYSVTNNSTVTGGGGGIEMPSAPVLAFAAVNADGNSIRMNFDHFMADSGDTEANFTVNTPEGKVNVTNVLYYPNVTTNDVLLILEHPIYMGEPVTVDYRGGTTAIRTMEGVELANFTGYSVTNNSTVTGGAGGIEMPSAPVLAFAAVNADGNSIRMNFDHFMADSGDTEANFTVNTPEGKVNVTNVLYYPNVTTNDVLLILEHPIYTGEPVTVDYTGGTTAIRTMEGVELANFTGYSVTNNSTVTGGGGVGGSTPVGQDSAATPQPPLLPIVTVPIIKGTPAALVDSQTVIDELNGQGMARLTEESIKIIKTTVAAAQSAYQSSNEKPDVSVVVKVQSVQGAKGYEQVLPVDIVDDKTPAAHIVIETSVGAVSVPTNMLSNLGYAADELMGISIAQSEPIELPTETQSLIGNRPIIDLIAKVAGNKVTWNNKNAPVTVVIPYTPTPVEAMNPDGLTVNYIDNNGVAHPVPNAKFDVVTNTIVFSTTHFSKYAVVFVDKTFKDLDGVQWARKAINSLASKGIISGVGNDEFRPEANIKRADLLKMMITSLGLSSEAKDNFSDVDSGKYYADTVAVGKALGIVAGYNGQFHPEETISRQDFMVIAYKAIQSANIKMTVVHTNGLNRFNDADVVSNYARKAIEFLANRGIVNGSNANINPKAKITRAEAAQLIYSIFLQK